MASVDENWHASRDSDIASSRRATGPFSVRRRPVAATAANSRMTVGLLFFCSRGITH